jgi:hypothetical protein
MVSTSASAAFGNIIIFSIITSSQQTCKLTMATKVVELDPPESYVCEMCFFIVWYLLAMACAQE